MLLLLKLFYFLLIIFTTEIDISLKLFSGSRWSGWLGGRIWVDLRVTPLHII